MRKVVILMSTYNGEKYVEEQIQSLHAQTYKSIDIVVRDDGSRDNTLNILNKYAKQKKIRLVEGKNLGVTSSFFELLRLIDNYDFYAFCDQDDIWMKDKIARAIEHHETYESKIPLLYWHNYVFLDNETHTLRKSNISKPDRSFNHLITTPIMGCTQIFNSALRNLVLKLNLKKINANHDYVTALLAAGLGKVVYDESVLIQYRRHMCNVSYNESNPLRHNLLRIKQFFFGSDKSLHTIYEEILNVFCQQLHAEDRNILELMTDKNNNFTTRLKKVFFPKRYRETMPEEFLFRLLLLSGRF